MARMAWVGGGRSLGSMVEPLYAILSRSSDFPPMEPASGRTPGGGLGGREANGVKWSDKEPT